MRKFKVDFDLFFISFAKCIKPKATINTSIKKIYY